MIIPQLATARLMLKAPCEGDFSAYRDFYADESASAAYGGPLNAAQSWRKLAYDLGHWHLRGYGMWSLHEQHSNRMVGGCGLVWPQGWPRSELTWWIVPSARRCGYALEASRAVIRFGYDDLHWKVVETHMADENEPARKLAEKLGGIVATRMKFPDGLERNVYALPRL